MISFYWDGLHSACRSRREPTVQRLSLPRSHPLATPLRMLLDYIYLLVLSFNWNIDDLLEQGSQSPVAQDPSPLKWEDTWTARGSNVSETLISGLGRMSFGARFSAGLSRRRVAAQHTPQWLLQRPRALRFGGWLGHRPRVLWMYKVN